MSSVSAAPIRELIYDYYDETTGILQILYTFSALQLIPVESPVVQGVEETIEALTMEMLASVLGVDNLAILPSGHAFSYGGSPRSLTEDYHLANYSARTTFPPIYAELGIPNRFLRSFFLQYKPLRSIEELAHKPADPLDFELIDPDRGADILLPCDGFGIEEKLSEVEVRGFRTLSNFTPVAYICEYAFWWLLMSTPGGGLELESSIYEFMTMSPRGALAGQGDDGLYDAMNGFPVGRRVKYNLAHSGLIEGEHYRYDNVHGSNGDYLDVLFPMYVWDDIDVGGSEDGIQLPPYLPAPPYGGTGTPLIALLPLLSYMGIRLLKE
jgi:hypothetical protein